MLFYDDLHEECYVALKQFIKDIEEGKIRLKEVVHDAYLEPWSGKYAVSMHPKFTGEEQLTIYMERKLDEPKIDR